jgi:hypothetical protein
VNKNKEGAVLLFMLAAVFLTGSTFFHKNAPLHCRERVPGCRYDDEHSLMPLALGCFFSGK